VAQGDRLQTRFSRRQTAAASAAKFLQSATIVQHNDQELTGHVEVDAEWRAKVGTKASTGQAKVPE